MKISQHQTFFSTPYGVIDWPRNRRSSGRSQQAVPFGPWTVGRGVTKRNSPPETTRHKNEVQQRNMVYLPPRPRSDLGFTFKACAEGRCRCEAGATKGIAGVRPGPAASSADRYIVLILPFAELAVLVFCAQGSRGCAQSANSLGLRKLNGSPRRSPV